MVPFLHITTINGRHSQECAGRTSKITFMKKKVSEVYVKNIEGKNWNNLPGLEDTRSYVCTW